MGVTNAASQQFINVESIRHRLSQWRNKPQLGNNHYAVKSFVAPGPLHGETSNGGPSTVWMSDVVTTCQREQYGIRLI